jgi:hypothetical protein
MPDKHEGEPISRRGLFQTVATAAAAAGTLGTAAAADMQHEHHRDGAAAKSGAPWRSR